MADIASEFGSFAGAGYGERTSDSAFIYSSKQEERNALWKARHTAYWAAIGMQS